MQNTWVWIVVVVVVLVGAFIWWQSSQSAIAPADITPITNEAVNIVPTTQSDTTSILSGQAGTHEDTDNPAGSRDTSASAPMSATVTYTTTGFSPSTVTVKKGATVKFVDQRGGSMWVGSGPHPGHVGYDGSSRSDHCAPGYSGPKPFDQCAPGTSYSFTFDKAGTWPYHDHMNSSQFGKVVVVE